MSKTEMQIGTAVAAPGTKANGAVHVANRPDGSPIYIPVMLVNGIEDGPVVSMDGCIHGDEYEGPEAIQALVARIDPTELRGAFIGVPVVNILAFQAMQRVTPHDPLSYPDVNRSYPGNKDGGLTARIAYTHFNEIVRHTDVVITVHSGASFAMLPPKLIYHERSDDLGRRNLEIARVFGWEILWQDGSYPGTLHQAAAELDIVCIAPEFGGTDRMPYLRAERTRHLITGALNVMKHLEMIEGEPELPKQWQVVKGESHLFANRGGLLNYASSFELGQRVKKGQKIASIVDMYGTEVEAVISPYEGLSIMMRTLPLVNAGDWVVGIGEFVRTIVN